MVRDILVETRFDETRIAVVEDGEPVEIYIETANREKLAGNIYRGKVERVLPGMQAAFVDIGIGKNAFLYADDIINESVKNSSQPGKIEDLISQGQEITVQVIKEEIDNKGARVTTKITLPGRTVVLTPVMQGIGVSKKIKCPNERERLEQLAIGLCPEGMGIIVRTAAEGLDPSELDSEIKYLVGLWKNISAGEEKGNVPRCIYSEPGVIYKLVRDYFDSGLNRLILDDRSEYEKILEHIATVLPGMKPKIEYFCKDYNLFECYNIDLAISKALSRKVWLKSGGYLVFDKTEALTVIDVNTGKYVGRSTLEETMIRINEEAAITIAKQIRLRNISGIILIDFIDMKDSSHKERLLSILKEAVKADSSKVVVVGMTSLGLVEMTRKKVRCTLQDLLTIPCPTCGGTGRISKS
ncbi:MAG: Rne/Rng family ribonuclease [Clostridiaceae bacterium]|jgi:ribonuclease G|nr:Rne/Rng family ribonuclease [Clostridiaceae bacterium]